MNTFILRVLSADQPFYQGEATSLVIPAAEGQYGIMANHRNMICAIVPGTLKITDMEEDRINIKVTKGMVKVEANEVLVLVEFAEYEELYELRLKEKEDAAAKDIELQKKSMNEYMLAQARLSKAMNKLAKKNGHEID